MHLLGALEKSSRLTPHQHLRAALSSENDSSFSKISEHRLERKISDAIVPHRDNPVPGRITSNPIL
jgi:hypothetical protein